MESRIRIQIGIITMATGHGFTSGIFFTVYRYLFYEVGKGFDPALFHHALPRPVGKESTGGGVGLTQHH
jgi:hypothetical protein